MNLTVQDLSFKYENQKYLTLDKIGFKLDLGSHLCIAGPNGSGKSTLLRIISGFLKNFTGQVQWQNATLPYKNILEWPSQALASQIGFIPAGIHTDFPIQVFDYVLQGLFPLQKKGVFSGLQSYSRKDLERAESILNTIGVLHLKERLLTELSTGERQLILIARALVRDPKILIFDESLSNLDFAYLSKIFEIFHILKSNAVSTIIVSHDLNLATEFCDSLLWIKNGTCLAMGKTEDLLTKDWIEKVYQNTAFSNHDLRIQISNNPFSGKPKIFWK